MGVAGGPPTKLVAAPVAPQAAKSKSFDQQQIYSTMIRILTILVFFTAIVALSSGQCTFRNGGKKFDVAEGEVTSVKGDKVRVCEGGKLIKKAKEEVPQPFVIGCGGCLWYGRVVCDGNVVKDLYRWWFESKCSGGKMRPVGRAWGAVVADKRFRKPRS